MLEYTRPYLYPKQLAAIFCPEQYAAIEASTKSGKTVGSIAWIVEEAFKGKTGDNYWWVAPVFPQADIAYRRIKNFLTPGSFSAFASPQPRIELITGSTIWIKSGDNPDSLYGEDVKAAVMDEASRNKEDAWHALRSTLTATRGKCRLIGNVKGRKNFFYNLARRAEKGDLPNWHYAKITVLDAIAAGVIEQQELEDAKRIYPEAIFRELYMAEAADDGGNPFGLDHIEACIGELSTKPVSAWGIDLAKKNDYLVLIGLDENCHVAQFFRWRGVPWRDSIRRIHSIVGEDVPAMVDSTGVGDPVLEELQVEHSNFIGFNFSLHSKQKLMEGLAISIQGHEVSYPDGPIRQELESFEYVVLPSGVRYAAAEGYYDDCVCALALARNMLTEVLPGAHFMSYLSSAVSSQREAMVQEETRTNSPPSRRTPEPEWIDLENELTELYRETLKNAENPASRLCHHCGLEINSLTVISDGEFSWHKECSLKMAA